MNKKWIIAITSFVMLLFVGQTLLFKYVLLKPASGKNAYIITQKVFEGYKGTALVMKKMQEKELKQKQQLDSLGLVIKAMEMNAKANAGKTAVLKSKYEQFYQETVAANEEEVENNTAALWKQINQHVSEYGKEKGYDLILGANGNGSVMYASSGLDMTEEVLSFINKKYEGQ